MSSPAIAFTDPFPRTGNDYSLCGLRISSELAFPELVPWDGDDRPPDVGIEIGRIPACYKEALGIPPLYRTFADGSSVFGIPEVACYHIAADGARIVVEPFMDASAPDIRLFFLGTVLGVLCYRRGLLPLHASCLQMHGGAVAFAGVSGVGKSTLAAALIERGFAVLADDVTVIDPSCGSAIRVLPTFPRLKLWEETLLRMAIPVSRLERTRSILNKYSYPVGPRFCAAPLPLKMVFHLGESQETGRDEPRWVTGAEGAALLVRDLYRGGLTARLGLSRQVMMAASTVIRHIRGVWSLRHSHAPGGLERSIQVILERAGSE